MRYLTHEKPVDASSTNLHAPASNTAAIVTKSASTGFRHVLSKIYWSYDAAPTGGRLTITDAGTTVFDCSITAAGPGFVDFDPPMRSALISTAMVVTLAAGGAGVTGKVNTPGYWTER